MQDHSHKPVPGQVGGTLIRRWISFARDHEPNLLASQILCACSGGADSTAIAQLVTVYGQRLGKVSGLLHFNHGWRGDESDGDEAAVLQLGRKLGIPVHVGRSSQGRAGAGVSPEGAARAERKDFFAKQLHAHGPGSILLTGHHADDLAETLLWRLMTGASQTHGAGIRFREGSEVRLALTTRRQELRDFLAEEGMGWREDSSNSDLRLLRGRIRAELSPRLDALFPRWVEHLSDAALRVATPAEGSDETSILAGVLGGEGVRVRRAHWEALAEARELQQTRSLDIEGGRKLTHEWLSETGKSRWILE